MTSKNNHQGGLTALRLRDSPPDILRRPRYTGSGSPILFPAAAPLAPTVPAVFQGATLNIRASIMLCSIACIIARFRRMSIEIYKKSDFYTIQTPEAE